MYDASELEILFKEFSFIQFKYKKTFPNATLGIYKYNPFYGNL